MNLYEVFINMYLQEVRMLVKHGIKSSYTRTEENLTCYKGKLMVNEHLRANLVHKERFYVGFDEYQADRPENRLIKATLLKLQRITFDSGDGATVSLFFVDVANIEESMEELLRVLSSGNYIE